MKRYQLLLLVLLSTLLAQAQPYGNEWIDYNKEYFKVTVASDGIYRISFSDLQNAGFPMSTDPGRLQMFYRGEEIAIYVEGEGDRVFNTTDFIEFYGKRNDGTLDAGLYDPEIAQPHAFYNIFSDSSSYFLTFLLTPGEVKRMTSFSENNVNGLAPEESHFEDILDLKIDVYSQGQGFGTNEFIKLTQFDFGEGWTSRAIQENESQEFTLDDITAAVQSTGLPQLDLLLVGRDNLVHVAEVFVGSNQVSQRSLGTVEFTGFNTQSFVSSLQWSDIDLATGTLQVRVAALGFSGSNDLLSTSYLRLRFPQEFDADGAIKTFYLNTNVGNKSFLECANVLPNSGFYDISDPQNPIRLGYNLTGSDADLIVDNTNISRTIFLNNGGGFSSPDIRKTSFRLIDPPSHNYIIISHKMLMQPTATVTNPVEAYGGYRASVDGGGYDTLIVDMDQLYNQFSFGEINPIAIYNFMEFMVENGDPEYLFLIGKGLSPEWNFHRNTDGFISVTKSEIGETFQIRDLVPPAGSPASDMAFTAGLGQTQFEPEVPVGRLPAKSSSEVLSYLNKVIEMESTPFDDLNRKKLLHLSGGLRESELPRFRSYVDGFADVATADFLGGQVTTIGKQLSSPVELINVADEVNEGLAQITFYGHSAPDVTDIDIGFVSDPIQGYNNPGKYPAILVNGCNSGEFFQPNVLFGEDWILAENKGAIHFIAHTFFGFENTLREYSNIFYEFGYGDSTFINESIGEVQKEVARIYIERNGASPANITQAQQMLLLGDPAGRLFGAGKPDYSIRDEDIFLESFNDDPVSAEADSFLIKTIVRNFGITSSDSLHISITRTLNSGSNLRYDSIFGNVRFLDTLSLVIRRSVEDAFGNNRFQVTLDDLNSIDELNELNNIGNLDFFIPTSGTRNLFPLDFAIVNRPQVKLVAQSADVFEEEREFIFELDSVSTFNSAFRRIQTVRAKVLAEWETEIPDMDSIVYFWRSRFSQPEPGENSDWVTSSFVFINNGPSGWSQSIFDQINQNELTGLVENPANKSFEFSRSTLDLSVLTLGSENELLPIGGDPNSSDSLLNVSIVLNNIEYIIDNGFPCRNNSVNLVAFDRNSTAPYIGIFESIGNPRSCGRIPQVINNFRPAELDGLSGIEGYIDNVSAGDTILLFTIGDASFSGWSSAVKADLEELGIDQALFNDLVDGEPIIILGKKGSVPGTAIVIRTQESPLTEQSLELITSITGVNPSGSIDTDLIGPASSWSQLTKLSSLTAQDMEMISVRGVSLEGIETVILSNLSQDVTDLTGINANTYPYLKLSFQVTDQLDLTAAQLNRWLVSFDPVAEGLIIPLSGEPATVQLQEGQIFSREFGFWNISEISFTDSIKVSKSLLNLDRRQSFNEDFRIVHPAPGDTSRFSITEPTNGKSGSNALTVFANPRILIENYYDNNVVNLLNAIEVNRDNINPVIDVVFDGEYILDGDIVSATPLISIKLRDENKILLQSDTLGMNIFLKNPGETSNFRRINFSSNEIQWFEANADENFTVEYRPERLGDGTYSLRIEANDASGNEAGAEPYIINFEVINESSITNFYPYPNPFSTNTRFVFTLTGSGVPDQIKIQIMTVSGKTVRVITQDELGPIRVGNNISEFAWDGKDEFGDQLANGVYLYRVDIRQNGESIDLRGTAGDKAFKNGIGKLYLLR
ncbi:MAG: C25 family cysteine peptidase [Bacteroidota bacterium]